MGRLLEILGSGTFWTAVSAIVATFGLVWAIYRETRPKASPASEGRRDDSRQPEADATEMPSDTPRLAILIYKLLRKRISHDNPKDCLITYSALVRGLGKLPPPNDGLTHSDERLFHALGHITQECKRRGLPTLSALVVRASDKTPGIGYYPEAHPDAGTDPQRRKAAWEAELVRVNSTNYPPTL